MYFDDVVAMYTVIHSYLIQGRTYLCWIRYTNPIVGLINSICGIQNSYTNESLYQTLSNTETGIQLSPRYLPEIALGILKEMGEIDSAFMEIDFVSSPHPLDRSSQDQEKKK